MKFLYIISICMLALFASCTNSKEKITDPDAYSLYLEAESNEAEQQTLQDLEFWQEKFIQTPNQFPYLAKIAGAYNQLFGITGEVAYLKQAEDTFETLNDKTHYSNSAYLKGLAGTYISQHKFKEALAVLKKAEANADKLEGTQKMLFDVHLELGNYELAKSYLDKFSNDADFDYLIRVAKWSDHRGDLTAAIKYLEQAKIRAEQSNSKSLKQWIYTNLADFYGHNGQIKASYNHFLKALALNPNNAYAKRGIAWIVYSHEKNPDEALRILNAVTQTYHAPDYYLLKAEIAEFKGDMNLHRQALKAYQTAVNNPMYGDMYNTYNVSLYANNVEKLDEALKLAEIEVANRPTPESYSLLAWTYYKKGFKRRALKIVKDRVANKTYEPQSLLHLAHIYKANNKLKEVKHLKNELLESIFELGPLTAKEIKNI
ncbi:tetratricopeptide repeat protein [Aestuariibaculum sediminum]|uniref:Tetratricopeptide repeat protein n=1 Tax=Aestuariibaculum sediminum TaxID=2770637 RepID=A0A8J6U8H6_9FLAO|nr:tetratricopeptide repeat protein [Aestuariibaculum sediminum]MBD0833143.1 tetratricopeptide repeat protein [Aestuariibaculum sediminum]